jgi:hypothetical protein
MLYSSFVNDTKTVLGLAPANRTATALSAACDLSNFKGAAATVCIGTFGDTQSASIFIEAELQESDDNVTYTPCPNANLQLKAGRSVLTGTATGTFMQTKTGAGADTAGLYEAGYLGNKRYLKVNMRLTGTHTVGTPSAVIFRLGEASVKPQQ